MRLIRSLVVLSFALVVFCGLSFADSFHFYADGTGKLANTETFTSGSSTITLYGYSSDTNLTDLFYKNGTGDEKGLGLNDGGSDHEVGGKNFIQFTDAGITSISIGSVQSGESWVLYGSNTLGTRGAKADIIAKGTGDAVVDLAAIDSGYTYVSLFSPKGDVLLDSASFVAVPEPGTPALIITLGLVGVCAFGGRKLFA